MKEKIQTISEKITFPLILFPLIISIIVIFLRLFNVIDIDSDSGVGVYSILGLGIPVSFIFSILYTKIVYEQKRKKEPL